MENMFKQSLAKTALVLMAGLFMAGTVAAKEMKKRLKNL